VREEEEVTLGAVGTSGKLRSWSLQKRGTTRSARLALNNPSSPQLLSRRSRWCGRASYLRLPSRRQFFPNAINRRHSRLSLTLTAIKQQSALPKCRHTIEQILAGRSPWPRTQCSPLGGRFGKCFGFPELDDSQEWRSPSRDRVLRSAMQPISGVQSAEGPIRKRGDKMSDRVDVGRSVLRLRTRLALGPNSQIGDKPVCLTLESPCVLLC
jgi:hypothetical protein